MTSVRSYMQKPLTRLVEASLMICWPGTVSRYHDHADSIEFNHASNARIALDLAVDVQGDRAVVSAALTGLPGAPGVIMPRQVAEGRTCCADGLVHLDVHLGGHVIAIMTLTDDRRLVLAQTALLQRTGFSRGAFDPPMLRRLRWRTEPVRAAAVAVTMPR